ncbi:hypothetical protein Peur_025589 [Populus x canadensis]
MFGKSRADLGTAQTAIAQNPEQETKRLNAKGKQKSSRCPRNVLNSFWVLSSLFKNLLVSGLSCAALYVYCWVLPVAKLSKDQLLGFLVSPLGIYREESCQDYIICFTAIRETTPVLVFMTVHEQLCHSIFIKRPRPQSQVWVAQKGTSYTFD